jgi:Arc/MetJ family transcription regulator
MYDQGPGGFIQVNLDIDDSLIEEAQRLGCHSSKEAAVNAALQEYVQRRKQLKILSLFEKIDYDPAYDHKRARTRKRG